MADLRPVRTMNIDKIRKLLKASAVRMGDATCASISGYARFDAAYDGAFCCALALLEANKLEMTGAGHHREALNYLVGQLKLRGAIADYVGPMVQARNGNRYDGDMTADERVVKLAIDWATRVRAEAETWFQAKLPLALKN